MPIALTSPLPSDTAPDTPVVDRAGDLAFTSYLRVAAIAGVVLIHCFGPLLPHAPSGSIDHRLGTALDLGASWCVPVFVMISGALLLGTGAREPIGGFYRRRLVRIGVPLVVWHAVYFAWRGLVLGDDITPRVVVHDVLATETYQALYFFWIILGLYAVTPVLRGFVEVASRRDVAVFAAGAVGWMWAVLAAARLLTHMGWVTPVWNPPALVLFLPYVGYFLLGHVLREVVVGARTAVALAVLLAGSLAFLTWSYVHGPDHPRLSLALTWGYQDLPTATAAVCVFLLARRLVRPGSRLAQEPLRSRARRLGELSFGVFLVHLLVLGVALQVVDPLATALQTRVEVALLTWAGVLASSFVVAAVLARTPVLRRTVGA